MKSAKEHEFPLGWWDGKQTSLYVKLRNRRGSRNSLFRLATQSRTRVAHGDGIDRLPTPSLKVEFIGGWIQRRWLVSDIPYDGSEKTMTFIVPFFNDSTMLLLFIFFMFFFFFFQSTMIAIKGFGDDNPLWYYPTVLHGSSTRSALENLVGNDRGGKRLWFVEITQEVCFRVSQKKKKTFWKIVGFKLKNIIPGRVFEVGSLCEIIS